MYQFSMLWLIAGEITILLALLYPPMDNIENSRNFPLLTRIIALIIVLSVFCLFWPIPLLCVMLGGRKAA